MSKTTLSVGKALDKLRSGDPPKSKLAKLDEDTDALRREIQQLRETRRKFSQPQAIDLDSTLKKP